MRVLGVGEPQGAESKHKLSADWLIGAISCVQSQHRKRAKNGGEMQKQSAGARCECETQTLGLILQKIKSS